MSWGRQIGTYMWVGEEKLVPICELGKKNWYNTCISPSQIHLLQLVNFPVYISGLIFHTPCSRHALLIFIICLHKQIERTTCNKCSWYIQTAPVHHRFCTILLSSFRSMRVRGGQTHTDYRRFRHLISDMIKFPACWLMWQLLFHTAVSSSITESKSKNVTVLSSQLLLHHCHPVEHVRAYSLYLPLYLIHVS